MYAPYLAYWNISVVIVTLVHRYLLCLASILQQYASALSPPCSLLLARNLDTRDAHRNARS